MEFPQPQTLGRTRGVNTVAADPNAGLIARPTEYEPQSLLSQVWSYVNNYGGNVPRAEAVKDIQTAQKAAPIGATEPRAFSTIVEDLGTFSGKSGWKTYADKFIDDMGLKVISVSPGARVPGPVPAPRTEHYNAANNMDQRVEKVLGKKGVEFVRQVKGLFNLGYEGPEAPQGIGGGPLAAPVAATSAGMPTILLAVAILYFL